MIDTSKFVRPKSTILTSYIMRCMTLLPNGGRVCVSTFVTSLDVFKYDVGRFPAVVVSHGKSAPLQLGFFGNRTVRIDGDLVFAVFKTDILSHTMLFS